MELIKIYNYNINILTLLYIYISIYIHYIIISPVSLYVFLMSLLENFTHRAYIIFLLHSTMVEPTVLLATMDKLLEETETSDVPSKGPSH